MSPSDDQTTTETSPLLRDSRPAGRSGKDLWRERFRFSPEVLLVPVVFASKLGNSMPATTVAELLRQTSCRLSHRLRGFPSTLLNDRSSSLFCHSPQVMQDFATVSAIIGVIGGITSLLGCGILSRVLPYHGRKPFFTFILMIQIAWSCLVLGSQLIPPGLSDMVFCVGMLFHTFSDQFPVGYLINMYIIDICLPEHRTAMMSKFSAWGILGVSIPLALGGTITTETGDPLIVFYIAVAIFVATFIYVVFVLPETFPEEKRNALLATREHTPKATRSETFLTIFDPLKLLIPTRTSGGTRNQRLTWCALHNFLFTTAHGYIWAAWFVLASSKYHLTPADNGIFWSCVTFTGMVTLMVIVPQLVRFLRPYYTRRSARSSLAGEGLSETSGAETSDHLDVHLAFVSCIFVAFSALFAAMSRTNLALSICAIFTGLAFMHGPTTHSLVSRSVNQLKQGRALAAIHMVDSAGNILSPIIMGAIFAATVDTTPLLLFYVHLVVILVSVGPLLLAGHTDGYRQSNQP